MPCSRSRLLGTIFVLLWLTGCTAEPSGRPRDSSLGSGAPSDRPAALLDGKSITASELLPMLYEAAGGQVLLEYVLDRGLEIRLADRGIQLDSSGIQAEQTLFLEALATNPDEAQRALSLLQEQRGLGTQRYRQLLWRNAALRALIEDPGPVTAAALAQAYELRYGPRYETRLIVTATLTQAAELVRRARAGESFTELAIAHSTDVSRAQGGLLPPVSLQDASFPAAFRQTIAQMEVGSVSDPVALDQGFAVLKLERKIDGSNLKFDDVKDRLAAVVRLQMQQMLMQRLARQIVLQSELVILDQELSKSYARAKAALLTD